MQGSEGLGGEEGTWGKLGAFPPRQRQGCVRDSLRSIPVDFCFCWILWHLNLTFGVVHVANCEVVSVRPGRGSHPHRDQASGSVSWESLNSLGFPEDLRRGGSEMESLLLGRNGRV